MSKKAVMNHAALRTDHQRHVRRINDIFIETQLSVQGLAEIRKSVDAMRAKGQTKFKISAPSVRGTDRNISRDLSLVQQLIDDRIQSKEYVQSLVFAVAVVESYLSKSLELVIRAYPQKLLVSPKGNDIREEAPLAVDVREVVKASSLEELIAEKASQRVRDASYATPDTYFKYAAKVLGVEFDEALRAEFSEIKATRDIHVHNDGIANAIYLRKAGARARRQDGEPLPIDGDYMRVTIACLKLIVSANYRGLKSTYGDSEPVRLLLAQAG